MTPTPVVSAETRDSRLSLCPVCRQSVPGSPLDMEQHVNRHLDEAEEKESVALAEVLHKDQREAQREPQPETARPDATLSHPISTQTGTLVNNTKGPTKDEIDKLPPAERMLRELEISDRAMAASMAENSGQQEYQTPAVLESSLTDTAEQYYADVLHKVLPFFEYSEPVLALAETLTRRRVHIVTKLDLFCSNMAGLGWDCGYRNIQMLFSAILYDADLQKLIRRQGISEVPSVPEIAGRIEQAWKKGFDPEGASNFDGTLTDKEVWIGATEVVVLFRSLNINALVTDFETPTESDRKKMFEWIYEHFDRWCGNRLCSIHRRGRRSDRGPLVAPIFCQWQGHSVTIIGAEKSRSGDVTLIILDPSRGFYESLLTRSTTLRPRLFKRDPDHPQMHHPRFQLVYVPSARPENNNSIWPFGRGRRDRVATASSSVNSSK